MGGSCCKADASDKIQQLEIDANGVILPKSKSTPVNGDKKNQLTPAQLIDNYIYKEREIQFQDQTFEQDKSADRDSALSQRKTLGFEKFKSLKQIDDINKKYKCGRLLGKGSFGEVRECHHIGADVRCAIKIVLKSKVQEHEILMNLMKNELKVLEETVHPNIVRVFELLEDKNHYYIVSELMAGGELYDQILQHQLFTESNAASMVNQLLLALNYMHQQNIAHRDIKPENILLQAKEQDAQDFHLKLTDFGFANYYENDKGMTEVLGSPLYMAPEIIKRTAYDKKVDVWSIGVVTHIFITGMPPFFAKTKDGIYDAILKKQLDFNTERFEEISEEAKDFMNLCLQKDPAKRADTEQLLNHSWIHKYVKSSQIEDQQKLNIMNNLQNFTKQTCFQAGVMSILIGLRTSSDQLKDLKDMFIELDTTKDGFLSPQELKQGMHDVVGSLRAGNESITQLMEDLDVNGDGRIDFQEFLTAAIEKERVVHKENLQAAFKVFDTDGNGSISAEELKAVFDSGHHNGDKEDEKLWTQVLQEVDTDGDNKISFQEFYNSMMSVLDQRSSQLLKMN